MAWQTTRVATPITDRRWQQAMLRAGTVALACLLAWPGHASTQDGRTQAVADIGAVASPAWKGHTGSAEQAGGPPIVSPDGGRYTGPLRDGLMHGQGRMEWDGGQVYEGGFERGQFAGQGRMTWPSGMVYEGGFLHGQASGQGRLQRASGVTYVGAFAHGMLHGRGELAFPNGNVYKGEFAHDDSSGQGRMTIPGFGTVIGPFKAFDPVGRMVFISEDGQRYEGEMKDWQMTGRGRIIQADGTVLEGPFEGYFIHGDGASVQYPDGSRYEGPLFYNHPQGRGVLTLANGDVYRGDFAHGLPEGEGVMRYAQAQSDGTRVRRGAWSGGHPVSAAAGGEDPIGDAAPDTQAQWLANVETVLYNQPALLARAFAGLRAQNPDEVDLYALLVAGDGSQEVFRREVAYVRELLDRQYGTEGRSLALVNSRTGVDRTPLATQHSLRRALHAIARVMDVEQDVLLLFLTSHGSRDHQLSLAMRGLQLHDLPAQTLADLLRESGIRNRIVIVSACYSGGFIPALQDERTLVITAARADRTSFGCADENDFTYFGRALFKESLADAPQTRGLTDAFAQAVTLVTQWEAELSGRTSDDAAAAAPAGAAGPLAAMLGGKRPVLLSEPQMQGAPAYVEWIDAQWRAWRRGALARP